jgi:thioredoxin 1
MRFALLPAAVLSVVCIGCHTAEQPPAKPGEEPLELTDANFQQLVLESKQPVLVDVYTTWCGPCRDMAPVVGQLTGEFKGRAIVGKLDADRQQGICRRYGVDRYPTFLYFKNGELVEKQIGGDSKQEMAARIEKLIDR